MWPGFNNWEFSNRQMFTHYRTQGIILEKIDRGEADETLCVLTEDFGKLEIFGRAIRKITSKLRSGVDIFYLSEIEFIEGRARLTLTDAILLDKFQGIKESLLRLRVGYKIAEAIDALLGLEDGDKAIFNLTKTTLNILQNISAQPGKMILLYAYFFWNLLDNIGYKPEVSFCISCQKQFRAENLFFSPKDGGISCLSCFTKIKRKGSSRYWVKILPDVLKILRIIFTNQPEFVLKLKTESRILENLKLVSDKYFYFLVPGRHPIEYNDDI